MVLDGSHPPGLLGDKVLITIFIPRTRVYFLSAGSAMLCRWPCNDLFTRYLWSTWQCKWRKKRRSIKYTCFKCKPRDISAASTPCACASASDVAAPTRGITYSACANASECCCSTLHALYDVASSACASASDLQCKTPHHQWTQKCRSIFLGCKRGFDANRHGDSWQSRPSTFPKPW